MIPHFVVVVNSIVWYNYLRKSLYLALEWCGGAVIFTVDYGAIRKNAQFFKSKLDGTKLCAVVKCDAYGHGIVKTAEQLADVADCFAVSSVGEADKIVFTNKDVLILLPLEKSDAIKAAEKGYIVTADSFDALESIAELQRSGIKVRFHLKFDTGMGRFGFDCFCAEKAVSFAVANCLTPEGAYTHFACSEDAEKTKLQFSRFEKIIAIVKKSYPMCAFHAANTAAALSFPEMRLDMVRVGLGLYGYGNKALIPAKKVTAKVLAVCRKNAGESVGYGGKFVCDRETVIAVLSAGYAFGLPRSCEGATVAINGQTAKVVGNVCMGVCMADVTGLDVSPFDEAVILGDGNNPVENCDNVIIYELLCNAR